MRGADVCLYTDFLDEWQNHALIFQGLFPQTDSLTWLSIGGHGSSPERQTAFWRIEGRTARSFSRKFGLRELSESPIFSLFNPDASLFRNVRTLVLKSEMWRLFPQSQAHVDAPLLQNLHIIIESTPEPHDDHPPNLTANVVLDCPFLRQLQLRSKYRQSLHSSSVVGLFGGYLGAVSLPLDKIALCNIPGGEARLRVTYARKVAFKPGFGADY